MDYAICARGIVFCVQGVNFVCGVWINLCAGWAMPWDNALSTRGIAMCVLAGNRFECRRDKALCAERC